MSTPAAIFWNLRLAHLRNGWALARSTAHLRTATIVAACAVVWGSLFAFAYLGFGELKDRYQFPLDGMFQELLFDVMFFCLSSLLLFSTAILLYTGLFASAETRYLLTTPAPDDHIFAYKLQGSLAFANWGFLLLGSPVLIAYGLQIESGAPWTFFLALPAFFLGFVLVPGSLGAIVCLLLVNFLPRSIGQVLKIVAVAALIVGMVWAFRAIRSSAAGFAPSRDWFESFVRQLTLLRGEFQPHHWVAAGLEAAAIGETSRAGYYLALVWSNGLLLYVVAVRLGQSLLRRGVERTLAGGSLLGSRARRLWIDRLLERGLVFVDRPTRLLIVKDFRTFRRDPAQWMQIAIFVGLLLFYFWSMAGYFERDIAPAYRNGIGFLTLVATSLIMCAYTGRFIYPLLSLEGRTFWLLGLLPIDRSRLVWGKVAFSTSTCLVPCAALIAACDAIVGARAELFALHQLAVGLIAVGLSGLSVSMGTFLPNFRETDPSKIAVGFGGTLNLVVGFLYLVTVIGLVVAPMHVVDAARQADPSRATPTLVWLLAGLGTVSALAATFAAAAAAARRLERMEF